MLTYTAHTIFTKKHNLHHLVHDPSDPSTNPKMERLLAQSGIIDTINTYAQDVDKLNRERFLAYFLPDQKTIFDLSSHLGVSPIESTASEVYEQTYAALCRFSATQHMLGCPVVKFRDDDIKKAYVKVMVCAYH